MKCAVVGGGAAGFFFAVNIKEMLPAMDVTIFERGKKVLAKVEISGGGRCNCTNTFKEVTDLSQVYPRGHKLLKRLFKQFGPRDAYEWFEQHGVPLVVQDDQCVFPEAQDSHAIINCFLGECRRHGVKIKTEKKIENPESLLAEYDYVIVTTGGGRGVPSLFTFSINDKALHELMGVVVENATASIPGTKMRSKGALLITHWGMSGPAILKLSSYTAILLSEKGYKSPLCVNWTGDTNTDDVRENIATILQDNAAKMIENIHPYGLQSRLWNYLIAKASLSGRRCSEIGKKNLNRLVEVLTNDKYEIAGRCHFKDEYVTCGGIPLNEVDIKSLESKNTPHLYYAGEVLDIDGVTGGFNFQAAWTTAYTVAKAIADEYNSKNNQV